MQNPIPITTASSHHAPQSNKIWDPYRIFFPLGCLMGLLGVLVWPMYALGVIQQVPSAWHIDLQLQGFLFAFILGFLMTALPRFSLTWSATKTELWVSSALFLLGNAMTFTGRYAAGRWIFVTLYLFLVTFGVRRFVRRKSNPPSEFIFVGMGLVLGLISAVIRALAMTHPTFSGYEIFGRRLMTEGMVLLLVLGIGGKLAPMFWGFTTFSPLATLGTPTGGFSRIQKAYFALASIIAVSFGMEFFGLENAALRIRAVTTAIVLLAVLKIYRRPKTTGVLVNLLWVSMWCVGLAFWGAATHPQYRVETLHVMFVGGFSVMILSIATRVMLSHGGYSTELEKKSWALAIGGICMLIAMVLRGVSSLFPDQYFSFLGGAGAFWGLGLLIWASRFIPKALFVIKTGN